MNTKSIKILFEEFANKIILKKIINHAFLFEVDDTYNLGDVLSFVKVVIKNSDLTIEELNNIYSTIDNNSFADLKIIRPNNNIIKKEQIIQMISEFKSTSIINNKRFYIIEYAEDLNLSAANTILKFLEEPNKEIIALLVTKKISNVLSTIVSRCQVVKFNRYNNDNFLKEEIDRAFQIILLYEKHNDNSVAYLSDLYNNKPDDVKRLFNAMIYIYQEMLKLFVNQPINIGSEYVSQLQSIVDNNDLKTIAEKINIIEEMINLTNYNVNYRMILDKLFLRSGGTNDL